jgi:hypothetical protein
MAKRNCCCIDHTCLKIGPTVDASGRYSPHMMNMGGQTIDLGSRVDAYTCSARGGTVVKTCHDCS